MGREPMQTVGATNSWEYVQKDGTRVGPFDAPQIVELLARGVISADGIIVDVVTQKSCRIVDVQRFRHYLESTTQETPKVLTLGDRWDLWTRLMERHGLQRVVGGLVILLILAASLVLLNAMLSSSAESPTGEGGSSSPEAGGTHSSGGATEPGDESEKRPRPASANVSPTVVESGEPGVDAPPTEELPDFDLIGPEATIGERLRLYSDKTSPSNHYRPAPFGGQEEDLTFDDEWLEQPHQGGSSIRINYQPKAGAGERWAGLSWQQPVANWGEKRAGLDLSPYNALIFWARGEAGGEVISEVKVGGIGADGDVPNPDSGVASMGPLRLTDSWQRYVIDLGAMDRSYVSGGLSVVLLAGHNAAGITVYLDDIFFAQVEGLKEVTRAVHFPVYVYRDGADLIHRYGPPDIMGEPEDVTFDLHSDISPRAGETCVKVTYAPQKIDSTRWSGMFWQSRPGGWGKRPGGEDLSGAGKLTFWMRGEQGGERIEELGFGGIKGDFGDTAALSIGPIMLTDKWQKFSLPLGNRDLSRVVGGFMWSTTSVIDPKGATFYLDEIRFEK